MLRREDAQVAQDAKRDSLREIGQRKERYAGSWLPKKIVQCRKVIGVSVDGCLGGWNDVVQFTKTKEKHNEK